ncbi:MAG: putative sulfate exporter family transporter [Fusobacteria bacterium]|nr:putative sulfate exporter family transporter [Fusobacteriota bacterium]
MLLVLWLPLNEIFSPGLSFVAKKILQYAVILLGFTLNISEIIKEGKSSLPLILTTISIALITAYFLKKLLKIDNNQLFLLVLAQQSVEVRLSPPLLQ